MKYSQMSDEERKTYTMLLNIAKPEINRHRRKVIIGSIMVFLVVLFVMIWYWIGPTVTPSNSLIIGGQFYALWGALLLALGVVSSPLTLGLMSMTRVDFNSKLFAELMKSRFSAIVGVYFVVGGFLIQGLTMVVSGI